MFWVKSVMKLRTNRQKTAKTCKNFAGLGQNPAVTCLDSAGPLLDQDYRIEGLSGMSGVN
jgi:hypothetical protein